MNVPLEVLPLPEDIKNRLKERGFLFVHNLNDADAQTLFYESEKEDIEECKRMPTIQSALDIWKAEVSQRHIVTFSSQLDNVLGGGVEMHSVTDFCGAPGTGKTQLCMQLCLAVQLPEELGGIGGESLFIDTNFGVTRNRLIDIAEGCEQHCRWMQEQRGVECPVPSVQQLLAGVRVFKAPTGSLEELLAVLVTLRDYLLALPQVRLVVIDSFSKPFLLYCESTAKRTAMICDFLTKLRLLAREFNLAIVTTSQLTTLMTSATDSSVVPGLGPGFAHMVNHRIMLGLVQQQQHTRRAAQVLKSPSLQCQSAYFQVLKPGVRDEGFESAQ